MKQTLRTDGVLVMAVVIGLAAVVGLSRWLDSKKPAGQAKLQEDVLYLNPTSVKRLSLAFNGIVADVYWMRSLQYVGNSILSLPPDSTVNHLSQLDLKLLAPMLDTAVTLDPQFMAPYQYSATILREVDVQSAIRLIRKGIDANPSSWRLYNYLGYIYWQQNDFAAASEAYGRGAELPGAPAWMTAMKARTLTQGGSRDTAREIYVRMYEEASDELVKDMARGRLMELDSLDERDNIRRSLEAYKAEYGRCPDSWQEMRIVLAKTAFNKDSSGALLDPSDTPYVLIKGKCDVTLDPKSKVPSR
ncbi:MAG TPA: hypothetical protein VJM12_21920 [Pyrinomonadaceae bacterium]|nr:hypothetical protein [Pyrinomonadaceae bacterium]